MKRAAWALAVILAAAAGLAGGLLYTWVLDPIETYKAPPDSLYIEEKFVYQTLIGDLYAYDGDLEQAQARLANLGIKAEGAAVADLVEQYLDSGGRPEDARNLARLAEDLGASGGVLLVFGPPPTPSPTPTVAPTAAPVPNSAVSPTPPPTVTPSPTFRLIEQTALCASPEQPGKILIWVLDSEGNELAGVEVVVSWTSGQDRFFTGLHPELGVGYGDFEMKPKLEYDVTLADFGVDPVQGLTSDLESSTCPTSTIAINWQLIFQQTP